MNKDRTVTVSFRLNLALEMDKHIYKFFNQLCQDKEMREYFGDKSKFIKTAVYNALEAVEKDMSDANIIEEISRQREMMEMCIKQEVEKAAAAIIQVSKKNFNSIAVSNENVNSGVAKMQGNSDMKANEDEANPVFGEIPDESDAEVPEDVMSFLDEL